MFDTHDTLHQALTRSGIWNGLYTALMASTPQLAVRSKCDDAEHCGLEFFEQYARVGNAPISGSIIVNLSSGALIVRADGYTGPRWHAALDRLASEAATGWTWQPDADHKPGQLDGVLQPSPSVTAETTIARSGRHEDIAQAGLALVPAAPEACPTAWTLAVTALGVLVTNEPTYRSTVLAEPTPTTDYSAAITTVAAALELLDENDDFGTARDEDPRWPNEAEGAAVRALRDFRDALIDVKDSPQHTPGTQNVNRGGCCDCPHEMEV
ncbi:hypothetical protein ABZW47_32405 [Streptomyces sp. NPDC004549]|uniref:hypothetical protein n=1 Tax=Streptomyces sp. NPDC004549 TaxID=3154283 RepID=UPI0033B5D267